MKKTRLPATFLAVVLILISLTACGKNEKEPEGIFGSWSYIHDKETAIAVFRENGTAEYEEKEYSFEYDSQFIKLKDADGTSIELRYELNNKGMYLYKNTIYTFSGEGDPKGLIGEWSCPEKNWTFAFTEEGTFIEDGYFPGTYVVNYENSTFKLAYKDHFEDTVCYFELEGNQLLIQYPWQMVRTTKN